MADILMCCFCIEQFYKTVDVKYYMCTISLGHVSKKYWWEKSTGCYIISDGEVCKAILKQPFANKYSGWADPETIGKY